MAGCPDEGALPHRPHVMHMWALHTNPTIPLSRLEMSVGSCGYEAFCATVVFCTPSKRGLVVCQT